MGLIYADIELANPKDSGLKPIVVKAMVDTGAMTICIPEHIAVQLQLLWTTFDLNLEVELGLAWTLQATVDHCLEECFGSTLHSTVKEYTGTWLDYQIQSVIATKSESIVMAQVEQE